MAGMPDSGRLRPVCINSAIYQGEKYNVHNILSIFKAMYNRHSLSEVLRIELRKLKGGKK